MNQPSSASDKPIKRRGRRLLRSLLILLAVIAIILSVGILWLNSSVNNEDGVWVFVPTDATDSSVRKALAESLDKSSSERVYIIWKGIKGNPKKAAGAYYIEPNERPSDIARRLRSGLQTPVKTSFSNVRTIQQMAKSLASTIECSSSDIIAACDTILPAEGYSKEEFTSAFIPETYEVYWNIRPDKLVRRLLKERDNFWNDSRLAKAKRLSLTDREVATLASIVEEESNDAQDRPIIARLYLNRLKQGMKLQADPTVKFAVGDFTLRRILNRHLTKKSPYNTYLNTGLPPGPIRIPSKSGLLSVLDAPDNDYLYMCAKEDFSGKHNFARTYDEHLANARKYQAALNARGIKK